MWANMYSIFPTVRASTYSCPREALLPRRARRPGVQPKISGTHQFCSFVLESGTRTVYITNIYSLHSVTLCLVKFEIPLDFSRPRRPHKISKNLKKSLKISKIFLEFLSFFEILWGREKSRKIEKNREKSWRRTGLKIFTAYIASFTISSFHFWSPHIFPATILFFFSTS